MADQTHSHEWAAGKCKYVKHFADTSSSTTLRKHLAHDHIHQWLSICNQKGIKVTAKLVAWEIDEYHTSHGESVEHGSEATRQKFLKEGFIDAVVEWIVSDDQVSQSVILGY